jgi:hypothetical protein
MKLKIAWVTAVAVVVSFTSCVKEAGEGGYATIYGKIEKDYRLITSNPASYQYTVPGADEEVYIVYGDDKSPSDRVWTNYNGEFEFENLRRGSYEIYVYSADTTGVTGVDPDLMAIKMKVEIEGRDEDVNVGTMTIYGRP